MHDRFGAAFPGFRRIFHLLADGHPETFGDQPLQIFIGAMDRHAAHGDVFAQMLAALGEYDAERFSGGDRVLEEQLVEVTHPVEQHAIGIGGLDLEKLRHRWGDAGRDRGRLNCGRSFRGWSWCRLDGRTALCTLFPALSQVLRHAASRFDRR